MDRVRVVVKVVWISSLNEVSDIQEIHKAIFAAMQSLSSYLQFNFFLIMIV